MKKYSVLLGSLLALSWTAAAQADQSGWYVGVAAGLNFQDDTQNYVSVGGPFTPTTEVISSDSGAEVLVTVGYAWTNIRVEGEVGYRSNDGDVAVGAFSNVAPADITQWSGMVNVLYDISIAPKWSLSLGGGLGFNSVELDSSWFLNDDQQSDTVFTQQLIAQIAYDIDANMKLYADYRYVTGDDAEYTNQFGLVTEVNRFEVSSQSLAIGLRIDLEQAQ